MDADLLEISRVDQAQDTSHLEPVDVAQLLRHVAKSAEPALPLGPVLPDGAMVLADRRRLERVIANLVDNAQAHAGGVSRVGLSLHAESVRIEVDDAGPGVPRHLRTRIFERFARAQSNTDAAGRGGAGLGLALVLEHTRLHGGTVWVDDAPGGGARFVVSLPRLRP
jgi:signal transduction histidine kinase